MSYGFMVVHRAKIISLVIQHKVAAISDRTLPTERRGLLSMAPATMTCFLVPPSTSIVSSAARTQQSFRFSCRPDLR